MMSNEVQFQGPRWLREFNRYLHLKNLFLLHGNIYDMLSYPVRTGEESRWCYFTLRQFLHHFFLDRGYKAVAFYDTVDAISFFNKQEQHLFEKASKGRSQASAEARQTSNESNVGGGSARPRSSGDAPSISSRQRDFDSALRAIRQALQHSREPLAIVIDHSSRLITSSDHLSPDERRQFTLLLKCMEDAAVKGGGRSMNHVLVLVCDKLQDLPSWLYVKHPMAKTLQVELPDDLERRRYFEMAETGFFVNEGHMKVQERGTSNYVQTVVDLTRGLTNYELECLRLVSLEEKIPLTTPKKLVEAYKFGIKESAWDLLNQGEGRQKMVRSGQILGKRVKGQDGAISAAVDIIKRAASGLSGIHHSASAHKPKGVLFFAGPTGVGKTELARSLAELLFGDENSCIRFDMSEYAQEHSDQKLMGAPPGYVGHEEGGQLTNKVKESPFAVLLFDEIEKAHPKIMDKFLQILEDGRITDGKGETVYFSESVIIFTSNIGAYVDIPVGGGNRFTRKPNILPFCWQCASCDQIYVEQERPTQCRCGQVDLERRETPYRVVKDKVLKALEEHFKQKLGRPEIYNRIGNNFVVFDYIRQPIIRQILDKLQTIIIEKLMEEKGMEIEFVPQVQDFILHRAANNIQDGGRGIGNLVETVLVNPLGRNIFDRQLERTRIEVKEILEKQVGEDIVYDLDISVEANDKRS
jgi:energy-coupling factor transporter ATP-binding protein EcfA2